MFDLFLQEENGNKILSIVIGNYEASCMSLSLDKAKLPRPLTYDLFFTMFSECGIRIKEVVIYKFFEGIFFANIICIEKDGEEKVFDARISDAINLSLKFNCPIFAEECVIKEAGFENIQENYFEKNIPEEEIKEKRQRRLVTLDGKDILDEGKDILNKGEIEFKLLSVLSRDLQIAIENEDFSKAAKLRDKIEELKRKLE
ncbi:MAG: bifunctional nuclease family protein [Bacteroidales bacterium]|nr:bifunctional nuclease family protein [Bacteroidales bacterium]